MQHYTSWFSMNFPIYGLDLCCENFEDSKNVRISHTFPLNIKNVMDFPIFLNMIFSHFSKQNAGFNGLPSRSVEDSAADLHGSAADGDATTAGGVTGTWEIGGMTCPKHFMGI